VVGLELPLCRIFRAGTLNITNGGQVNSGTSNLGGDFGAMGTVAVYGPGSTWTIDYLSVGYSGAGTLNITNGGMVCSNHGGNIGSNPGSMGTMHVDGTGSTWTNSEGLTVGDSGAGTLTITGGGQVRSVYESYVGLNPGATGMVAVDGAGSAWTNNGSLFIGFSGAGTLNITNGGQVNNTYGDLGYNLGSAGTVTVDGAGSTWTNSYDLYVGDSDTGTLYITNGGMVAVAGTTYVAYASTATGSINFGDSRGTLTTQSLYAAPAQLSGTGTINTRGIVGDGTLIFDATHGLNQTLAWISATQNVAIHLDLTGGSGAVGDLGAGYQGAGTLTILDGVAVTSNSGYLGYQTGSLGYATVSGSGSTWANSSCLYVGHSGTGTLNITNGGQVNSSSSGYLGLNSGATGTVTVDGSGSIWTNNYLYVGNSGAGTLHITNGGQVNSSSSGYLGYNTGATGTVTVDGSGSTWTNSSLYVGNSGAGTLHITNGGQVNNDRYDPSYLGYNSGATGTVTVDGPGSKWISSEGLAVGASGAGTLTITGGGEVSSVYESYVGLNPGATER